MFCSRTFTKGLSIAAISDYRLWKLSHAGVFRQGNRISSFAFCRIKRLEIQTLPRMDPGNQMPDEKELSSVLVAMSFGEARETSKDGQSDVSKLKATRPERRNVPGKIVNDLGKVEVGKVAKVHERHDTGKSQNEVGKVETRCDGETEGQHDVGKSERRHDVGKTQNEVGKVESESIAMPYGIHDEGKIEDNKPGKFHLKGATEVGKNQATIKGKIEEIVECSKLSEVKEVESTSRGKQTFGKSGTAAACHLSKVSDEGKGRQGSMGGKNEQYSAGTLGTGSVKCLIVLAAKYPYDSELIPSLTGVTELKLPEGVEMLSISEVTDPSLRELFDASEYLENLKASQFGAFVLYSPSIPSTHTLLSQNFHAFPKGTICIASSQLQGKGRAGNVWESPKGCLMFSFTIKMTSGRLLPFLQYVVSLAVIEGLDETCEARGIPAPEVRIKWPNDLYAKGLKIGGVLCTSTYSAKTFNIVVGVGLNVGNRVPTTCLDALIQELDSQAGSLRKEELLAAIMSRFEKLNDTFSAEGFSPLQDSYYDRWLHSGQTVVLEEKDPKTSEVSHISVTIRGLTPTGYLLATDEKGEQYELHPDGNSFDFLKGLMRSKLAS